MLLRFSDVNDLSVPFSDEIVTASGAHSLLATKSRRVQAESPDDASRTGRGRDCMRLVLLGRAGVVQRADRVRMSHGRAANHPAI